MILYKFYQLDINIVHFNDKKLIFNSIYQYFKKEGLHTPLQYWQWQV